LSIFTTACGEGQTLLRGEGQTLNTNLHHHDWGWRQ